MRFEKQIAGHLVYTDANKEQATQIQSLFHKIEQLYVKGPTIQNGTIIGFGWSNLKLVGQHDGLVIMEPDFSGNALSHYLPQVTITLKVLEQQVNWLHLLKVDGESAYFNQTVLVAKGCLQKSHIYLERLDAEAQSDSGWFIGEVDSMNDTVDEADLECMYIYQLYQQRPALMQALALPTGFLVVFKDDGIEAILNPENKKVFAA